MNTDCLSRCFSNVVKIRPGPPSCTWLSVHFEQALCQPTRTWVEQEEIKIPSSSNNSPWRHLIQGSPWVLLVSRSQGPLCGRSSAWPQGHLENLRFTSANNQENYLGIEIGSNENTLYRGFLSLFLPIFRTTMGKNLLK